MKIWRPNSAGEWPRADLRRICALIDQSFRRRCEQTPRVVAIATADDVHEEHLYETLFEFAPGVVLSVTFDFSEDEKEARLQYLNDPTAGQQLSVAEDAAKCARHHLSLGVDHLADRLLEMRIRVRRKLASMSPPSGGPRLISLRLTNGGHLLPGKTKFIARLQYLDHFLLTDAGDCLIEDLETIDAQIDNWMDELPKNYALLHALAVEGATGTIDLLTLNALSRLGDARAALRVIACQLVPSPRT